MSSRQKKRLLKGEDDLAHLRALESPEEDATTPTVHNKKSNKNFRSFMQSKTSGFAALNDVEASDRSASASENEETITTPSPTNNKNKKKKQKKKNKKKAALEIDSHDIDSLVKQLDAGISVEDRIALDPEQTLYDLFKINTRNLNSQTELTRIFGKGVAASAPLDRRIDQARMRSLYPKSNFVQPKVGEWAPIKDMGFSMVLDATLNKTVDPKTLDPENSENPESAKKSQKLLEKSSKKVFNYQHSKFYQKIEKNFRLAIELHQDHEFTAILGQKPYHVNTLLTMADVYRSQQDYISERYMVEQCLYGLESGFDSRFSLADPKCRIDYRRPENRGLFLSLYQHAVLLSRRACNRTALETMKLLLNLDPIADPLGVFLMIDHFALLSGQYDWLLDVSKLPKRNLDKLPNFAYSLALGEFRKMEELQKAQKNSKKSNLIEIEEIDEEAPLNSLISAIIKFPGVIPILAEKLNIDISPNDKAKLTALDDGGKALVILYKLYVERSSVCWQGDTILPFLYKATNRALGVLSEETTDYQDFKIECDSASLNRKMFKSLPENILRHLVISGFDDSVNYVHLNFPGKKVLAYDPFPPKDEITSYEALSKNWRDENVGGRLNSSTLANFMETLVRPNVTVRDMLERVRAEDGGVQTDAGQRIRQEMMQVYDMFREQIDGVMGPENPENSENNTVNAQNTEINEANADAGLLDVEIDENDANLAAGVLDQEAINMLNDEELARRLQEEEWD